MASFGQPSLVQLRSQITCPHCWKEFPPEDILWIAESVEQNRDSVLGERQERFPAEHFTVDGDAIDQGGRPCRELACPQCHLSIPRQLLEMDPLFISFIGTPSSGKSYFLAAMTHRLRRVLHGDFSLTFLDADLTANRTLLDYEGSLFQAAQDDQLTVLAKTQKEDERLYEAVLINGERVWYPKPFLFSVQPLESHSDYRFRKKISRVLCLYDNAGEHFLPGGETSMYPIKHLALSQVLFFLFDPTQHHQFRKVCGGTSKDPQFAPALRSYAQHETLSEAANRIRSYTKWPQNEKYPSPLIVVVTKQDAWKSLVNNATLDALRVICRNGKGPAGLDTSVLTYVSGRIRTLLLKYAPEIVGAAEGFSPKVTYIPVSALGHSPEKCQQTQDGDAPLLDKFGIRPRDVHPQWVEVPMLYAFHLANCGLIRAQRKIHKMA